jgi:outer membrane receptor for ferrienterochelin and colicins
MRMIVVMNFRLIPLALALLPLTVFAESVLEPVVVSATRSERAQADAPVKTEIVTRQEIERTHARTLTQALQNIPGLQLREIHGKSGYELSLQGLNSDQVLVLIDGLPISASTGSTVNLSQYLVGDIERIEVVKGAASAQYGSSAMGGVINVITRRTQPGWQAGVDVSAGSYGAQNDSGRAADVGRATGRLNVSGGNQQWRVAAQAEVLDDQGFAQNPAGWTRQGDAMRREQYGARVDWLPSDQVQLWLDASRYLETDTQRYQTYVPPNRIAQQKVEDIGRDRWAAGGQWNFGAHGRLSGSWLNEQYDTTSIASANGVKTGDRRARQLLQQASLQLDLPAWYNQLWQVGIDLRRDTLDQQNNGYSELQRQGMVERKSRELYVQNDIFLTDQLELVLGVRGQHDSDFGGHLAPKAALKADLLNSAEQRLVGRASWGQGYRVPNLKERYYLFDHSSLGYMVIGNPDLRPEESDSYQLGLDWYWGNDFSLQANAFYNRIRNLIQVDRSAATVTNGVASYQYDNIAAARTAGLELAGQWQLIPELALNAAYTYTHTRDEENGQQLTRRPEHMARFGLDWTPRSGSTVSLRTQWQSEELVDASRGTTSPAWHKTDLSFNQQLGRDLTAYAGVNNLFNAQRDFSDANDFGPLAGRFIYLGARYQWGANTSSGKEKP